jgi:amidase
VASINIVVFNSNNIPYSPLPALFDLTIDDMVTGFAAKQFASVDLVKAYVARIPEVLEALRPDTEINPEAIAIAQVLDNERLSQNKPGTQCTECQCC